MRNATNLSLDGRVALVTGATRGIGAAISDRLAANGACVIGTATRAEGAEAIGARLADAAAPGAGYQLDVADPASVEALFKQIKSDIGLPSIVVNNAAVTHDDLAMRMSEEDWSSVIEANLSGVYRVSKAALRGLMKAENGRIVNISSVVGQTGNAGQINYSAAKAGLLGLTRSLAREVGSRAVTVNAVAPGFIDTDMTQALDAATRERMLDQIPLDRLGAADEVADAVSFLASPAAGYITGETLSVNGGLDMGG
ncbi:3-oxoacyl-ACP reductase FabG [Salinisphaera orenii]|uniref:3-oxoacyl-ACP reductase FabG n=1 Tax=Salinisphaera orenii TaxID=856731 RepID=UPI003A4C8335